MIDKRNIIIGMIIAAMLILTGCGKKEVTFVGAEENTKKETQSEVNETGLTLKETSPSDISQAETNQVSMPKAESGQISEAEAYTVSKNMEIYVHVCGAVKNPGVYQLAYDARVYEAIEKAGGFLEDAAEEALNQAQTLQDGQKLFIPTKTQWEKWQETGQTDESGQIIQTGQNSQNGQNTDSGEVLKDGLININTASKEELCTLPGVGESRAQSIIAYREEKGSFATIEEIKNVTGIKDGLFEKIKDKIKVK